MPLLQWSLWCLLAASPRPGPHLPWRCGGIPVQPPPRVRGPERSARLVIVGFGGGGSPGDLCGNDVSKVYSRLAIQGGLTLGLSSASGFVKNHLKLKRNNPVRPVRPALPAPTEHLLEQIASALKKNLTTLGILHPPRSQLSPPWPDHHAFKFSFLLTVDECLWPLSSHKRGRRM